MSKENLEIVAECFRAWDRRDPDEDLELSAAGDMVVAVTRLRGTGTASGAEVETPFAYIFTLRDGLLRRVGFDPDPQEALDAAGVTE